METIKRKEPVPENQVWRALKVRAKETIQGINRKQCALEKRTSFCMKGQQTWKQERGQ